MKDAQGWRPQARCAQREDTEEPRAPGARSATHNILLQTHFFPNVLVARTSHFSGAPCSRPLVFPSPFTVRLVVCTP
jgi:hypothetical protein